MDRRQRKTREAIFKAFIALLSKKYFNQITVGEVIERADIGRATFYAHFETKDFLLKALCEELFCHIFDAVENNKANHRHIFDCEAPSSAVVHLLEHLKKNDNCILDLLAGENNELFLKYFKENLKKLIKGQPHLFGEKKSESVPDEYWINHICATFVETVRWWTENGMTESPENLAFYFTSVI